MEEGKPVIGGTVEAVMFQNPENGYTVMEISYNDDPLTVVGNVVGIAVGEEIKAEGYFINHPTYGRQFKASFIEHIMPERESEILRYLSSGAVKGIGPVLAKRIVSTFGRETLRIMEEEPARLSEVKGITSDKAERIGEEFKNLVGIRALISFLAVYDIDTSFSVAVFKKWGQNAKEFITEDPYCICCEDIGVPFQKADVIADNLGFSSEDICRIKGAVLFVLSHNLKNGHSCIPEDKLIPTTSALLSVDEEKIEPAIDILLDEGRIIKREFKDISYIYLPEQYIAEDYAAGRLSLMLSMGGDWEKTTDEEIEALEEKLNIRYDPVQKEAIKKACDNSIMILTGGPGTGKTTTLQGIIELFGKKNMKVLLGAPTGRAAKRLSEVTGKDAKTVHRLLEVDYGSDVNYPKFIHDEKNPLKADAVIIDEMSMVDIRLFASLLKSLRLSTRLIMVGDPDQLPSVGAGNVLKDLISSGKISCVHLTKVFRQAQKSLIVTSAHLIVKGIMPDLGKVDSDFFFMKRYSPDKCASLVCDLYTRRLPNAYNLNPTADIQVLCPGRQGPTGTIHLNSLLQDAINPPSEEKAQHHFGQYIFREGDKVMQTKNNYDMLWQRSSGEEGLGVFNGDIGTIKAIDNAGKNMLVEFEDRLCIYPFDLLSQLEPAYAVTIHKSQGSEFEAVIIPLMGSHKKLHFRNLLYTAVTRAKKLLIIAGSEATVAEMINNDRKTLRYTLLSQLIEV